MLAKCSAVQNRNAIGLEVIRRNHVKARPWPLRRIGKVGLSGNREGHSEAAAFQGQANRNGGILHAGHSLDAGNHLLVIRIDLCRIFGPRIGHGQKKRLNVARAHAEVHLREIPKAVNRQAGACQQ